MIIICKVLLGFLGLVLLFLSGRWLFDTQKIAAEHNIQSTSATGGNYLRGDIGGILLAGALFIGLFIFHGPQWMWPGIILLACVSSYRLLSMVIEGYSKQGAIAIAVELLIVALLYTINVLG